MGSSRISRSCREKRNPTSQRPNTRRRTCGEKKKRERRREKDERKEDVQVPRHSKFKIVL